jgi:CRISPR-associated Csx2 family protein
MSKILIWSLGTGQLSPNNTKEPSYIRTNYKDFELNKVIEDIPYVADAFIKLYEYDKHIIVGTCGSSWYNYYEYITQNTTPDEDYAMELLEEQQKEHYNDNPDEFIGKLEKLKKADKKCAGIILLKYAITPEEMQYNFEKLLGLDNIINNGDVVSFDITHSFRSLAFYELLAVTYNMLRKNITLDRINYGMVDLRDKELNNTTPMVNLKPINTLIDYIKAAEEYKRYGTTRLLADLIETAGIDMPNEQKKALKLLGDMSIISSANRTDFKGLVRYCNNYCDKTKKGIMKTNLELDYIFKDISKRFGEAINDDVKMSAELSKWHFEYKRYMESAGCIAEGMLDYFEEISGLKKRDNPSLLREKLNDLKRVKRIKGSYPTTNSQVGDFLRMYDEIRDVRNDIMHGEKLTKERIKSLDAKTKEFYAVYTKHFKGNEKNVNDLMDIFH